VRIQRVKNAEVDLDGDPVNVHVGWLGHFRDYTRGNLNTVVKR
jgi:hypothetical protein